jgi:uncharacterized protein
MNYFSQKTLEKLDYYVYILLDPRDKRIFYVGKGHGNRVFDHLKGAIENSSEKDKITTIKKILGQNLEVAHYIIRHGLKDESMALEIEATLIDMLTFVDFRHLSSITNLVSGHGTWDKGIKTVNEIEALYAAEPMKIENIKHNLLLININKNYRVGVSPYEATRYSWKLDSRRIGKIDYDLSEYKGIIRAIYKPVEWFISKNTGRKYFDGFEVTEPEIISLYLNKAYTGKKRGQQNPCLYLLKNPH